MKKIIYLIVPVLLVSGLVFLLITENTTNKLDDKMSQVPNDWFFRQRAFPFESINHNAYLLAIKSAELKRMETVNREEVEWDFAGPTNIEGRITDIELSTDSPQAIYIGAASGGVFKSTNQGADWLPIFDIASSLSIGDIAISPSNSDVVYVGTGEANAGGGSLAYDGTGIFKSTDAGLNWEYAGLENSGSIGRMVVHPENPDIVYVAAMGRLFANGSQGGVFKTTDGGQNWEQKLFISDSTGAIDILIDPDNPETVYTAMWERVRRPGRRSYGGSTSGIYKSSNGGDNWTELTNGLPTNPSDKGRIGIDICNSNPQVLYAVYADKIGYFKGIYKSINGGETWEQADNGIDNGAFSSYGWWFGRVKVDPVDPDIAYLIAFELHKTSNGGSYWNTASSWQMHVDQHAVAIDPENNNNVYVGNDGGFYSSQNGGSSWNWSEKLPITQFYTCEVDEQHPERIYGGTQDNGTNRTMTGALNDWYSIYGGDGFRVLVDPVNNNYVYAEYQYGGLGRSTNGGSSFTGATNGISYSDRYNWNCPIVFNPQNSETLYFGTNKLYKSTNRAASWSAISGDLTNGDEGGNIAYNTLTTISVSPVNPQFIYTGSDDGNIWFTPDEGNTWNNISFGLPNRWVSSIVADPVNENFVYVTFSGYRWDEYLAHVFRSDNNGLSWVDISYGLPEVPVNELVADPEKQGYLYIATDVGVYYSEDNGENWIAAGTGMPILVVNDLRLHNPSRKLVAATYGRGIYTLDLSILTELNNTIESSNSLVCYPNPFSDCVNIKVHNILQNSRVNIEIINSSGQLLTVLYDGIFNDFDNVFKWNGTDSNGHTLPNGIYFVKFISDEETVTKKILLRK